MISICIIIPTHNRKNYLKNTLLNISKQKVPEDVKVQIIVVNDGSSDGTLEMLRNDFPNVHIVNGTGNWWYTKCMNEGFKKAEKLNPDFILTLNDDVILSDDYFLKLNDVINKIDRNTIVNSISLTIQEPHKLIFSGVKKYTRWRGKQVRYFPPFTEVNPDELTGLYPTWIISGRGILIPYHILKSLNYFDEKFPQYGSDDDFGLRAIKAGYKVLISRDLKIYENTKLTSKGAAFNKDGLIIFIKSFFNKYSVNSISKTIRFTMKHGYPVLLPINIIITVLGTCYAYFIKYKKYKESSDE